MSVLLIKISQSVYPRETIQKCAQWAMDLRAIQKDQSQKVFQRMCANQDESIRLQLLLHLHCALEELMQALPDGFADTLIHCALKVLPRQYAGILGISVYIIVSVEFSYNLWTVE